MPRVDPQMLARARAMRQEMSEPETRLWLALRGKRLEGAKFTRQTVRGRAIPDFVARSRKLVIEVDGDSHAGSEAYDARRTAVLKGQGYLVLRFTNHEVMTNLEGVLSSISAALAARPLSQPVSGRLCPRHGLNSAGRCLPETPQRGESF